MWNLIFSSVKNISGFSNIVQAIETLIGFLEVDYLKDGNARDALIDAIIQVLQSHKSNQGKPQ
jgi:hypothetical protein